MKCDKCGKSIKETDRYCQSCGNPLIKNRNDNSLAIVSVVMGGISILFGTIIFPIAIIGLILGICQKGKSSLKTVGIVLNVIGLVFAILLWTFLFGVLFKFIKAAFNEVKMEDSFKIEGTFEDDNYNDWENYITLREGARGKEMNVEGEWRILSNRKDSLVIKDGVFHYYNDSRNKKDNYMTGTYEVVSAREKIVENSKLIDALVGDEIGLNDYYFMVFYPSKTIKDSKEARYDKYEITCLLVDHENEGIEAKMTSYDNSGTLFFANDNFIKIAD